MKLPQPHLNSIIVIYAYRPPRRHLTIRSALARLVIAAALPIWLATACLLYQLHLNGEALVERDAQATARALMVAVDRDLASAQTAALVLSTSPDLIAGDLEGFHRRALALLNSGKAGIGSNIVLTDGRGQQRLNGLVAYGQALPQSGNPDFMRRVFAGGHPEISDLYSGAIRKRPVIAIAQPVFVNGAVAFTLSLGLFPEQLGDILRREYLPDGWIATIFDSQGVIVAKSPGDDQFVGKKGPSNLIQQIQVRSEGVVEADTYDGIPVSAAFSRSDVSGWSVAIAIPQAELTAELRRSLGISLGTTSALVVLGLIGANYQARRLARPIHALKNLTLAFGRDEPTDPTPLPLKEADEVARAFAEAAGQLRARTAERDRADEQQRNAAMEMRLIESQAQARADYFAYLSHELGAPLMAIRMFSEAIARATQGTSSEAKCLEYCDRIGSISTHLLGIIDEILDYAKCEADQLELHTEQIDVSQEIMAIAALFEADVANRSIKLEHVIPEGLPPISADRRRFRQVIINLVSNSVKFTPPNGSIKITAEPEGGAVVIRIVDTGIGIAPEELPLVLRPFVQGTNAHAKKREGTGLGLPFAKALVERHGGEFRLESVPGAGTTATVRFPQAGAHGNERV